MSGQSFPFPAPIAPRPVQNHKTDRVYQLTPVDGRLEAGPERLAQVVAICNQPAVYELLFAERLGGAPYGPEMAERFFAWGRRGWAEQTHYLFLLLSPAGEVAGAIDIKSADRDSAETGYWLHSGHSGVMTNALVALTELARDAGYRELHAFVRLDNPRSAGVLTRAGFTLMNELERSGRPYRRYARRLDGNVAEE